MTPSFEIALAIGLILGSHSDMAFARSISYRTSSGSAATAPFLTQGTSAVLIRANAGYMTISPGEEAEARGREPWENRLSYLADATAPSMTCAHWPGSTNLTNA